MNKDKILDVLELEGLSECDDISYNKEIFILDSYYILDKAEIEAAKSFANENYKEDLDDTWYDEYYFPYLYDIVEDNIKEVLEEICEDEDIKGEFTICEMDRRVNDKCEVITMFSNNDFDVESVLENIDK